MKIRYGFVSNSSTTSFCIYGAGVSIKNLKEAIDDEEYYDIYEYIESLFKNDAIEVHYGADWHTDDDGNPLCFVGQSYKNMRDHETLTEFKLRITNTLNKYFKDIKVRHIEKAWRDG
jgi:hypothetical protein